MRKGFTLIELLAVIVILAVIALIATPIILGIISDAKKSAFKDTAYGITEAAKNEYVQEMYENMTASNIIFTYTNGVESPSIAGKILNYSGVKPNNGIVTLTKNGDVAIAIHDGTLCAYKSYSDKEVAVEEKPLSECTLDYSVIKEVNIPNLAQGMTPIKWNGTTWIDTTVSDKEWYSYDITSKKWANARTADGSMWVWIPRYIYKIENGWHSSTSGTIKVQFSKGTKDDWNDSITLDTGTTSNASNNTWTTHPAFTFGSTQVTGIWVSKFEAAAAEGVANGYTTDYSCPIVGDNVSTKTIKIQPNLTSWRCLTIGNVFTAIRNMETKSIYGWSVASGLQANGSFSIDANNLDTHLMKNIEWGAIAYLSKSDYGQGINEIYINNSRTYTTGCAGNTASEVGYSGCQNTYESAGGVKASTTGNIYGIYDMSGSAWERVAAYIDNGTANLNNYGSVIINATSKYKDVYTVGGTDDQINNYALTINKKGDALYETSNSGSNGSYAWFGDYTYIPNTTIPWFKRGSNMNFLAGSGIFSYGNTTGGVSNDYGFRPVIVVNNGL